MKRHFKKLFLIIFLLVTLFLLIPIFLIGNQMLCYFTFNGYDALGHCNHDAFWAFFAGVFLVFIGSSVYIFRKLDWQIQRKEFIRRILILLCFLSILEPYQALFLKGASTVGDNIVPAFMVFAFMVPTGWINLLYLVILLFYPKIPVLRNISFKKIVFIGALLHILVFYLLFTNKLPLGNYIDSLAYKALNVHQDQGRFDAEGGGPVFLFIPYLLITLMSFLTGIFSTED